MFTFHDAHVTLQKSHYFYTEDPSPLGCNAVLLSKQFLKFWKNMVYLKQKELLPPKQRITSHKTCNFNDIAIKTSNLELFLCYLNNNRIFSLLALMHFKRCKKKQCLKWIYLQNKGKRFLTLFQIFYVNYSHLPIRRLFLTTRWFPRVYSISTVMGAEYVKSRSLHSCGVVGLEILYASSTSGVPTLTFRYLK